MFLAGSKRDGNSNLQPTKSWKNWMKFHRTNKFAQFFLWWIKKFHVSDGVVWIYLILVLSVSWVLMMKVLDNMNKSFTTAVQVHHWNTRFKGLLLSPFQNDDIYSKDSLLAFSKIKHSVTCMCNFTSPFQGQSWNPVQCSSWKELFSEEIKVE